MTPAERDLLIRFLSDLAQARAAPKDPEAAGLIGQALNANPDGPYLLVQHTILADQALHAAQARIAELETKLAPAGSESSFLGGGGPWGGVVGPAPSTAVPTTAAPVDQGYATEPPLHQQAYGAGPQARPRSGPFSAGGGLGSFLRGAATTAAGVAGGEMLFEGLTGLFRPHYGFGGGGFGGFGGGYGPEDVVVNNYYDDNGGGFDDGGSNNW